jgi:hypothetical protein
MAENSSPATTSSRSSEGTNPDGTDARVLPIHIIDLGKRKSGDVKDLKRGHGKLLEEVGDALEDADLGLDQVTQQDVVPLIIIVERKRKRRGLF